MSANNLREMKQLELEALCEKRGAELLATAAELAELKRKGDELFAELRATNEKLTAENTRLKKEAADAHEQSERWRESDLDKGAQLVEAVAENTRLRGELFDANNARQKAELELSVAPDNTANRQPEGANVLR